MGEPLEERKGGSIYTCLLGTQKKATDPSGTGRKTARHAPVFSLSNYVRVTGNS